jgi:hypothetical protein
MSAVETVRVVHPDDPAVMMTINVGDLRPTHRLWSERHDGPSTLVEISSASEDLPLRVVRGPRGRWYVKRGAETVAGPFETEAQALDAATAA